MPEIEGGEKNTVSGRKAKRKKNDRTFCPLWS